MTDGQIAVNRDNALQYIQTAKSKVHPLMRLNTSMVHGQGQYGSRPRMDEKGNAFLILIIAMACKFVTKKRVMEP